MRFAFSLAVGATVAAASGLILGEYPFTGFTPYLAALLVPLVLLGSMILVAGESGPRIWLLVALLSAAGLAWAVWISTGRGLDPAPLGGWIAVLLALVWPLAWAGVHRQISAGSPRRS
ncbi:MAG: hypothetical protein M3R71_04200 [Actinomycetota bacterium]|nr:hypothetical protein [Actinomycetota bacterium]